MRLHRSKYGAVKVREDGHTFDSKAEHKRYGELKLLERAGQITCLKIHQKWPLSVNGTVIGYYESDAEYWDVEAGKRVVEDVKGCATDLYKWKKKHLYAEHGIEITEVKVK